MWRVTRYSMVLWGYPPHQVEKILPDTIHLLNLLSGQSLVWNLSSRLAQDIPAINAEWVALAAEYRQRSSFGALDMTLESSAGPVIGLSLDAPLAARDFDVLSIGLDTKHLEGAQALFTFDNMYVLFLESLSMFQPFWARVYDKDLIITDPIGKLHFSVDLEAVPDTIHWLNYFDEEMVERLGGKKKLLNAPVYQVREWENPPGVILILQHELFDFHNHEHLRRQAEVVEYLELKRLHTLYPKKRDVHLADRSLPDS